MADFDIECCVPVAERPIRGRPVRDASELVDSAKSIVALANVSKRAAAKMASDNVWSKYGFPAQEAAIDWVRRRLV
jgi:hypothetical protein